MKRLGQHFLINQSVIKKIVEALDLRTGDTVIEIGAGHGELTKKVIELMSYSDIKEVKIIAIEKDKILAASLKEKFFGNENIEIVEGDALKIFPNLISQSANKPISYKLVGNIPYYITGKLLRIIGELEPKPARSVLMLQKEVAERLCAEPPRMNRFAASVQFWAEPKIIARLSRDDFRPKPEVNSAVVQLETRAIEVELPYGSSTSIATSTPEKYYRAVRIIFQQPRKTILNNLSAADKTKEKERIAQELQKIGIDPNARPQDLAIKDIIRIAKTFY